ncbi:hypothetical protein [Candidatus Nitrosotalea okcheonensis]|nr:hypothetical protein [Candidatus Nitrosotalea okcheonensis]
MNTPIDKLKPTSALLGVLVLLAIVTIFPHAFAQLSYTDANNPHGPLQPVTWAAGLVVVGVVAGVGVFTTVKHK